MDLICFQINLQKNTLKSLTKIISMLVLKNKPVWIVNIILKVFSCYEIPKTSKIKGVFMEKFKNMQINENKKIKIIVVLIWKQKQI